MSVYFVTCRQANAVKIGCSSDPFSRAREIQVCCPLPVKLEAVLPGRFEQEAALHARFAEHRLSGEWFTITPLIEDMIAANPVPPQQATTDNPYYRAPNNDRTLVSRVRAQLRVTQIELAEMPGIETSVLRYLERGCGRWKITPPEVEQKLNALSVAHSSENSA